MTEFILKYRRWIIAAIAALLIFAAIVLINRGVNYWHDYKFNRSVNAIEQNANEHLQQADNARDNRIYEQGQANQIERDAANSNAELQSAANDSNAALSNLDRIRNSNLSNISDENLRAKICRVYPERCR